jgi:hypothetical protein
MMNLNQIFEQIYNQSKHTPIMSLVTLCYSSVGFRETMKLDSQDSLYVNPVLIKRATEPFPLLHETIFGATENGILR